MIRPLLIAIGYANHEILAQAFDAGNKYPDYKILPDTNHAWFLEAKAWNVALESLHVDQAMNYAHSNGRRWVALTNGKEWRLYDDHIQGVSSDRLVATATLQDSSVILKFLKALSRESMIAQKVDEFASERRLREFLTAALIDPGSSVIQSIVQTVKKQLPTVKVDPNVVVELLGRKQAAQSVPAPEVNVKVGSPFSEAGLFSFEHKGVHATGRFEGSGIVILAGSQLAKVAQPSSAVSHGKAIQKLVDQGLIEASEKNFQSSKGHHFQVTQAARRTWYVVALRTAGIVGRTPWGVASMKSIERNRALTNG